MTNKATDKPLNIEQCCNKVAVKYDLGKTLVTGHREKYWLEAAELYKDSALDAQKEIRSQLSEHLAIIYRDGDHHESKVGTLQAIKDAIEKHKYVVTLTDEIEALKQALKKAHNLPPYL